MEEFYPSEIARLVLGYLSEMKCEKTWKTFLEESSDLQEYFNLFKRGKVYTTKVNGNSLSDILTEYCSLKREALKKGAYQELSSRSLNKQEGITAEAVEKIIKNALDVAFEKYFPSACKSRLKNYVSECRAVDLSLDCRLHDPVSEEKANDSGDSVVFIQSKNKKDKSVEENVSDGNRTESANHPNIQLDAPETVATPMLRPNITNVMSVSNRAYNSMHPSENESASPSLLALQTAARCFHRNGSNEISTNDSVENSFNKKSCDSSQRAKSPKVPIVIKIEDEDLFTSHITAQKESNNRTEKASVQRKVCESTDSGIEGEMRSSETASGEPEQNLPNSGENTSSLEAKNLERDNLRLKSDKNVMNSKPEDNIDRQVSSTPSLNYSTPSLNYSTPSLNYSTPSLNCSTPSLNCSNLSFQQVPPLNMQNSVVNTLGSANNLAGFSISSSSVSKQLTALSDFSLSSVPTFIWPNFSSSSQIVQNSTPYQFVIKTPTPLTVPTVPVNSVSNTVFTLTEPRKDYATSSQSVPIPCSTNPPTTTDTLSGTKNSNTAVVKGTESVKRKNKSEALPESKRNNNSNSSEDASKKSADSPSKKKRPASSKSSNKPKTSKGKKQKQRLTRSHKQRLNSSELKVTTSTEENDLPETDCQDADESSNDH